MTFVHWQRRLLELRQTLNKCIHIVKLWSSSHFSSYLWNLTKFCYNILRSFFCQLSLNSLSKSEVNLWVSQSTDDMFSLFWYIAWCHEHWIVRITSFAISILFVFKIRKIKSKIDSVHLVFQGTEWWWYQTKGSFWFSKKSHFIFHAWRNKDATDIQIMSQRACSR